MQQHPGNVEWPELRNQDGQFCPSLEFMPMLLQEVSRHSSPVDVVALAASAAAAAASSTAVSRIAVQSLGFDDTTPDSCVSAEAAGGDLSAETAAAAAAARDGDGSGGGAAPGAESQHSASEAGGVVRAVHALKSAARRSRCAIMVSVPAGVLPCPCGLLPALPFSSTTDCTLEVCHAGARGN